LINSRLAQLRFCRCVLTKPSSSSVFLSLTHSSLTKVLNVVGRRSIQAQLLEIKISHPNYFKVFILLNFCSGYVIGNCHNNYLHFETSGVAQFVMKSFCSKFSRHQTEKSQGKLVFCTMVYLFFAVVILSNSAKAQKYLRKVRIGYCIIPLLTPLCRDNQVSASTQHLLTLETDLEVAYQPCMHVSGEQLNNRISRLTAFTFFTLSEPVWLMVRKMRFTDTKIIGLF